MMAKSRRTRGSSFPLAAALAASLLAACGNREPIADDPRLSGRDLNQAGLHLYREGDLALAQSYFEEAIAEASAVDDLEAQADARSNLSLVHRDRGDLDAALSEAEEAERIFRSIGGEEGALRCVAARATLLAALGRTGAARSALEDSIASAPPTSLAELESCLAAIELESGSLERARELAEKAAEDATGDLVRSDALFTLAAVLVRQEDFQRADGILGTVLDLDRAAGRRRQIAATLLLRGKVAERLGDSARAADYFRRAGGVYSALGIEPEAEKARRLAAAAGGTSD